MPEQRRQVSEAELELMAWDDPWPTIDVLRKLVEAGEHLLRDHSCDVHGWEEIERACRVGRDRLERFDSR